MQNDDPYADGGPPASAPAPKEQDDSGSDQTELLAKSFFQGKDLEVGARCEVEITQVHDDQVSVRYVSHDEGKEEKPPEQMPASEGMAASESDHYA